MFRLRDDSASARSSDASCSNGGDTTDDDHEREQDDRVPRRRPGFGPLNKTPKRTTRGFDTETETEGEGGFLTAEEGALTTAGGNGQNGRKTGSILERSEGEETSEETETETEGVEDDRDGKKENVVVCLRSVSLPAGPDTLVPQAEN